ncbi:CGNR zinc finger domain-containing protein [Thermoleophilia bacterium SCSIO 60948]|nr:CGNR zinc finger domain-containing protein [Thermoleophilia bacterium SCSIO 60948]
MDVAELNRQVEYKQAPAPLLAVQALLNTYDFSEDEEVLLSPESTAEWLLRSDLAAGDATVDADDHRALVELRTALRAVAESHLSGELDATAESTLAELAARHPVRLRATGDGGVGLDLEPVENVDGLISQMLGIVFESQRADTWSRLKICGADDCRWAFYDASKNRGGHWCRMDLCGNRAKNRTYRERGTGSSSEG